MDSLLISADESAQMLGIGRTLFYSMHSSGRLGPMPIKLGRRSLWNRKEVEDGVELGCPARKQWLNRRAYDVDGSMFITGRTELLVTKVASGQSG